MTRLAGCRGVVAGSSVKAQTGKAHPMSCKETSFSAACPALAIGPDGGMCVCGVWASWHSLTKYVSNYATERLLGPTAENLQPFPP